MNWTKDAVERVIQRLAVIGLMLFGINLQLCLILLVLLMGILK